MKKNIFCVAWIILCVCSISYAAPKKTVVWKSDFSQTAKSGEMTLPKGWEISGTKSGVNKSFFNVVKADNGTNLLHMSSEKARGGLLHKVKSVDLNKAPIIRWKWKAIKLPEGGDGRFDEKGDQAIEIYVISGGLLNQKCIVYTWETETPKNASKSFSIFMGAFKAKWFCVRNKTDKLNHWYIDERNVAEDFKNTYGLIPDEVAVMPYCKSDMTQTSTEAELAWIEFLKK